MDLRWTTTAVPVSWEAGKDYTAELNNVGRAILKHFMGIECVTVRAEAINRYGGSTLPRFPNDRLGIMTGDVDGVAKAIRKVLDGLALKGLKEVRWMQQGRLKLDEFAEKVKHEKLEETVKMKFVKWDVSRPQGES